MPSKLNVRRLFALVRKKKYIDVAVDTRIITIQSQKEEQKRVEEKEHDYFYIRALDNRNIKNITIHHALSILSQQMKLSCLRKRTVDSFLLK